MASFFLLEVVEKDSSKDEYRPCDALWLHMRASVV